MSGRSITIVMPSTDRDVIDRIALLLGGGVYGPVKRGLLQQGYKPMYCAQVKGPAAAGWMMTIYCFLGVRRRAQVERALSQWRAMRYVRVSPLIRRAIVAHREAGVRSTSKLARQYGISRTTVYRILGDHASDPRFHEAERAPLTPIDIAWLAGLLEGEGNIAVDGQSLTLRIKMTDHDVVCHAATLLGCFTARSAWNEERASPRGRRR